MSYSDFKTYVGTYLWRQNDTVLNNNFDTLIAQSNNELEKMTRDWQRRLKTVVLAAEAEDVDLSVEVPDFQAVMSLTNNTRTSVEQTFRNVSPSQIYAQRARNQSGMLLPYYCVTRDGGTLTLRLVGSSLSVTDPADLTLEYVVAIPDYAVADASWLEDEYLNLYLYTVLKHCAMFLREDERVQTYAGLQTDAFTSADMDDKHNLQFGGSPLKMAAPRQVP
jgi:hypothetical protein